MTWTFDRAAAGNVALMGEQFIASSPCGPSRFTSSAPEMNR